MKKYYYECPIKALYMHKEFGVDVYLKLEIIAKANLTTRESEKTTNEYLYEPLLAFINDEWGFEEVCKIVNAGVKIVVGNKSNHIFEPIEGDYILFNDEIGKVIDHDHNRNLFQIHFDEKIEMLHQEKFKIVFRDGKHFFMPKVELNK